MRVLWVTREFPDAHGSGAQVHQFELLRAVAASHQISIISSFWDISREALLRVQEMGVRVEVVPWPWNRMSRGRIRRVARLLRGAAPNFVASAMVGQVRPLSQAVAAHERYRPVDLVCILQGDLAPVADVTNAPTALFLFDVVSRQADLVLSQDGLSLRSGRRRLERRTALRWEPLWYRKADSVACVSSVDAAIVAKMLDRNVTVIPNPIPDEFFARGSSPPSTSTVAFIGSLSWEPNADSVRWICSDIWPRVRARRPDARLRIVGRFPTDELRRLVEAVGGEFLADVGDVRPFYWGAAVVIAPVRMGSGMRNKVLHAMACRAPLVATPSALEGIPAVAGKHLLVAEGAGDLADAVVATLDDPASAAARAGTAFELARHYTSAAAGAALESWWRDTAALRPAGSVAAPQKRAALRATVVVCTRDRRDLLRRCLASVQRAVAIVPDADVVVVEQGEPFAAQICSDIGLAATVVPVDGSGVSRARNIGLRNARGDVVLFTDDDCEVPTTWVRDHLEALREPDVDASFGQVTGLSRWGADSADAAAMPSRHRHGAPPWLIGHSSNLAGLKSRLLSVGGFDERLGPGSPSGAAGEDADLIVRLLRSEAALVSGTGEAVRHIPWRTEEEDRRTIVSYEHGAGVWIGKALREEPLIALSFLRSRLGQLKGYLRHSRASEGKPVSGLILGRAFLSGLLAGLRVKPWNGPVGSPVGSEQIPFR